MKSFLFILSLLFFSFESQSAVFVVDRFEDAADTAPGDGQCKGQNMVGNVCSLRAAIQESNALVGEDLILVPNGTYEITLAGENEDAAITGDLDITDVVSITNAALGVTINGNFLDRIFQVHAGGHLTLNRVTLTNGVANTDLTFQGGAIKVEIDGALTANEATFVNNLANRGGALFSDGDVVIENSYFHHNAITNEHTPQNLDSVGSAILNRDLLLLATTTIAHNGQLLENPANAVMSSAQYAMHFNPNGINADAPLSFIFNSTIADNGYGGIRSDRGITDINQSTIANHISRGIRFTRNDHANYEDVLQLKFRKSLVANNGFQDCNDPWVYPDTEVDLVNNFNASSDESCGFTGVDDIENIANPFNGSLHQWGGFAPTLMLNADSDAIDSAGNNCTDEDQRGSDRPLDGNQNLAQACDMGAVELNPDTDPVDSDVIFKNDFDLLH